MKTVILCGGLGTRLREETEFRPKPMVEIGGRPILWHIMKLFAHYNFREFVLCLGYKGAAIKEYFLSYEAMNNDFTIQLGHRSEIVHHGEHQEQDFRVTLVDTGLASMTGARIRRVSRYLNSERFMATYGDGVADVDLRALLEFHVRHGKLATVTTVRAISRFGVVDVDDSGQVRTFAEKPSIDGWVSAGFFIFEPGVLDYLEEREECVLERQPLERLAAEGQLIAYRHNGFFFAMDTYREYETLNRLWNDGAAPWKVWA
jgi:glucose-1-phosphate cytidylyltransferase